ncbi:MAG: tetratricopeptide repeat protein [Bacteroidia bacterium]|jgi:Ca-activated chloride channel family protein|nr:tetratricopeptide repeat protein [Bacteroidia bacterium]MBP7244825.1 tetratricopeptide repeat protein [Bacteroidia bacterium]
MKRMKIGGVLLICLCISTWSQAQRKEIVQGNTEYEGGRYHNAEAAYKKSVEKAPQQFIGSYNLGNALYRQNKFDEASQQYLNASANNNVNDLQSKAMYNMGNSLLKSEKYAESIEAYKKALRLNPKDEDARYNLSYAQKKLQQQQQQQDQNKDNKDNKDKKDQQKKDQQQDKKDQQKKDQEKQDQQKDDQAKQDQKKEEQKKQEPKQPKLSKEEAERMLKALKNDEKDLQKEKAKKYQVNSNSIEKNW